MAAFAGIGATCLGGCGSIIISSGPAPTTTLAPHPSVTVGLLAPLTGADATQGQAIKDGAELAVTQYNASGSHPTVYLDVQNAAGTAAQVRAAAQDLVRDQVVAVIGPATDGEASAADPVLENAEIPVIDVAATSDALSSSGNAYFHRVVASDSEIGADDAQYLIDQGVATVQVVDDGLSDDSTLVAQLDETLADSAVTEATPIVFPSAGVTAAAVAGQVMADTSSPGAVAFVGPAVEGGALVEALSFAGYSGIVLLGGAAGDPESTATQEWASTAGDLTAYFAGPGDDPGSSTTEDLTFVRSYAGAYGVPPPEWSAQAFDATNCVLAALTPSSSSSGSDTGGELPPPPITPATVEAALGTPPMSGVSGTISFASGSGDLTSPPVWISELKDGVVSQQGSTGVVASSDDDGS